MNISELKNEIDEVSILLYQNREQEGLERLGKLFIQIKELSDALLGKEDSDVGQTAAFVSNMYRNLNDAYSYKDMLGMADCLQEYVVLAAELYQIKFQAGE